ncbi:MAG: PGF-pre-PGF domain-containing protein, partial [Candidatus Aenigmarchaeota archaeon]|nr:PGF-pre-PGF domain-containing protein [Candidatus Aenigmarchaeota archaeon]
TTTDSSGDAVGYVGMIDDTRDKIVNNLYPRVCRIKIPSDGTCTALWHCDDNGENCVDRSGNATSIENGTVALNGTNYCVWQIPYCEFSVWASGEPGTTSGDTPVSSSGGGGGGGGGSAITAYAIKIWLALYPETPVSWAIDKTNIAITQIDIAVKDEMRVPKLTVNNLSSRPSSVGVISKEVYQYLNITPQNIVESNLGSVKLTFRVERTWITDNNIDENTVSLNRYHNGVWNELTTTKSSEDETYIYYQAETPGFSIFVITGEEKVGFQPAIIPATTIQETTTTIKGAAEIGEPIKLPPWLPLLVFLMILVAFGLILKARRKEPTEDLLKRIDKELEEMDKKMGKTKEPPASELKKKVKQKKQRKSRRKRKKKKS